MSCVLGVKKLYGPLLWTPSTALGCKTPIAHCEPQCRDFFIHRHTVKTICSMSRFKTQGIADIAICLFIIQHCGHPIMHPDLNVFGAQLLDSHQIVQLRQNIAMWWTSWYLVVLKWIAESLTLAKSFCSPFRPPWSPLQQLLLALCLPSMGIHRIGGIQHRYHRCHWYLRMLQHLLQTAWNSSGTLQMKRKLWCLSFSAWTGVSKTWKPWSISFTS